MAELFASGRIVDLILVFVVLEVVGLLAWRRLSGRGPSAAALIVNVASGACLMLAVRGALTGADWTIVAACLVGSLLAHSADLVFRFRQEQPRSSLRRSQSSEAGTSAETPAFNGRRQAGMISS